MANFDQQLQQVLLQRQQQQLYRQRRVLQSAQGTQVVVDGQPLINFCSNDYLGLANHPVLIEAASKALKQYGVGSGASHLVIGHSAEHHALEEELSDRVGSEKALLFSSGYQANIGVITALCTKADWVLQDKLNHASLIDGAQLAQARLSRYLHNDVESLKSRLVKVPDSARKLIATDAVFSMDGDIAPLKAISEIASQTDAVLMVDDAHGFGVLGKAGAGSLSELGLSTREVPIYMATLGKALGSQGAFVAGSSALIETLIQFSRSYIYSTALPPSIAAASRASLRLIAQQPELQQRLQQRIAYFRYEVKGLGYQLQDSTTAIQPLLLGSNERALQLSDYLYQRGLLVSAIRPPTVPVNTARLRITLSAAHTESQIDQLLLALAEFDDE